MRCLRQATPLLRIVTQYSLIGGESSTVKDGETPPLRINNRRLNAKPTTIYTQLALP
ncbi:hypothetical protein [Calothrix sp. NIES-2100]|uniref:hypothetical protein n=1 Tax=Calothrix sp. NIES-2100 TaxID=1954172 RepID=UPI0030D84A68